MLHHVNGENEIEAIDVTDLGQILNDKRAAPEADRFEELSTVFYLFLLDIDGIDARLWKALRHIVRVLAKAASRIVHVRTRSGVAQESSQFALDVPLAQEHQPEELVEGDSENRPLPDDVAEDILNGIVLHSRFNVDGDQTSCDGAKTEQRFMAALTILLRTAGRRTYDRA